MPPRAGRRAAGWFSLATLVLLALVGLDNLGAEAADEPAREKTASEPSPGDRAGAGADRSTPPQPEQSQPERSQPEQSHSKAVALVHRVIQRLAHGPAFDAKVRERVWTAGREVVGVGTYEQAGEGSGCFNLQLTMHDGDGKHTLQQISDGRLAWTRTQIGGKISLTRVDVGRLAEWLEPSAPASDRSDATGGAEQEVSPQLKVGGWIELLDQIERDYVLRLSSGSLQSPGAGATAEAARPVWILSGRLRQEVREERLQGSGRERWPPLCPTRVRVAIASTHTEATGFGKGLPLYLEFWSEPGDGPADGPSQGSEEGGRHLISLIELYSIRPISPPPVARFRFDNQDIEVNFVNETQRYLKRYGMRMTRRQQRELRR